MTDPTDRLEKLSERGQGLAEKYGNMLVDGFHTLALFAIGATIVWSAAYAFLHMAAKGHASIEDILLLFIFLELGAMVGIYFKTNHMPVRFLIYVAITALTRMLIGSVNLAHEGEAADFHDLDLHLLAITGSILLLAVAALVLRYASYKYPSKRPAVSDT
jgi:phosphate starvation-inducible membrane PsiE